MKKKFMKWKGFRILTAVCMALLLLLGVVPGVWASDTGIGGQLGSLSMTLAVNEDGAAGTFGRCATVFVSGRNYGD